jgi:hypothetical protein
MASADSDRFSAIFTQVESLHKQGMDQRHPRGSQIFARRFFLRWLNEASCVVKR